MRWVVEHSLALLFLKTNLCIGLLQASLLNHQLPQLFSCVWYSHPWISSWNSFLSWYYSPIPLTVLLFYYFIYLSHIVYFTKKKSTKFFFSALDWFLLFLNPLRAFQHLAFLIIPIQLSPQPPSHTLACLLVSVPTRPLSFIHWTNHLSSTFSHKTPS